MMNWLRERNLTLQVADWMREQIASGAWQAGSKLPNEQELCESLSVSRGTLRNSLLMLEREGFLSRRQGLGTFVRKDLMLDNNLNLIFGTKARIRSTGMEPGLAQLNVERVIPSQEVASALDLNPGEEVILVERVHTANGVKAVYSKDYLPLQLFSHYPNGIPSTQTLRNVLESGSLVHFMQKDLGVQFYHSRVIIQPENASNDIAELLDIHPGTAIMRYEQVSNDPSEKSILYSLEYCVGKAAILNISRIIALPSNKAHN